MARIEAISIREFRGIRNLDLHLGGKTFVIYGPNGSGKSGVVDAIEFVLRGSISRLSGEGTGQLSLAEHAPHALSIEAPENAIVQISLSDPNLSYELIAERGLSAPRDIAINPDTTKSREVFSVLANSTEFTLSRSAILKYVVSAPGPRSQQIQALLGLDRLERLRGNLKAATNLANRFSIEAETLRDSDEANLASHIGNAILDDDALLSLINQKRVELGAPEIAALKSSTDFLEGVTHIGSVASLNATTASRDINALIGHLSAIDDANGHRTSATNSLESLLARPDLVRALRHRSLLQSGVSLVNSAFCPLCGSDWGDPDALIAHITQDLLLADEGKPIREQLISTLNTFAASLTTLRNSAALAGSIAREFGPPALPVLIETWVQQLDGAVAITQDLDGLIEVPDRLSAILFASTDELQQQLVELAATVNDLPTQSPAENAWTFLTVGRERWGRVIAARTAKGTADLAFTFAQEMYRDFCTASDEELNRLYADVEDDFVKFYRFLNSDDEPSFTASFTPLEGSLDLQVDFYGIGSFPPNAFHSEGHQDSMGMCLYLALMRKLSGDNFTLCVLDDVVMSVDTGHRRRLVDLLKTEFPNVQFVITTHDEVWTRQLLNSSLTSSRQHARFYGWTIQDGRDCCRFS